MYCTIYVEIMIEKSKYYVSYKSELVNYCVPAVFVAEKIDYRELFEKILNTLGNCKMNYDIENIEIVHFVDTGIDRFKKVYSYKGLKTLYKQTKTFRSLTAC